MNQLGFDHINADTEVWTSAEQREDWDMTNTAHA